MGLSFIPFPPWALFFCYVPLWFFALKRPSFKSLFIGGWFSQFAGTLIGFNYLNYTIKEFDILPWPLSLLGLIAFASLANLHIPIALSLWSFSEKALIPIRSFVWESPQKSDTALKKISLLFLPLYSLLSMEYYYIIFKWHFGYTWLYAGWPAFQTAEIWGFQFLNSLTLFFNFLFLLAFKNFHKSFFQLSSQPKGILTQKKKALAHTLSLFFKKIKLSVQKLSLRSVFSQAIKNKGIYVPLSIGLALFFSLNIYGLYLKSRWTAPDSQASVLLVQPHIENQKQGKEQWDDFISSRLLQETSRLLWPDQYKSPLEGDLFFPTKTSQKKRLGPALMEHSAIENLDFILWPEGAWPYPINKEYALKGQDPVQKWPLVFNTPLIVSAEGHYQSQQSNSIFVFDREGRIVQGSYDKMILMLFGEKAPFIHFFPKWSKSLFGDITFDKGHGDNKIISLNGLNLGFQICYESLFARLTRDLSTSGADILINVANDSWFGSWQEPLQNLYMTLARAIEVRRPLLRGTNSGLSAVISAKGELTILPAKKGAWFVKVPYSSNREQKTVFALWGHLINPIVLWFSLIALILILIFLPKNHNLKNQ